MHDIPELVDVDDNDSDRPPGGNLRAHAPVSRIDGGREELTRAGGDSAGPLVP